MMTIRPASPLPAPTPAIQSPSWHTDKRAHEWLKKARLRPTLVRLCVAQALLQSSPPVNAEELHQGLAGKGEVLSLASVYRTLREFETNGFISREWHSSQAGAKAVFRVKSDGAMPHTCLLVCPGCGGHAALNEPSLLRHLAAAFSAAGYRPAPILEIPARCPDCAPVQDRA